MKFTRDYLLSFHILLVKKMCTFSRKLPIALSNPLKHVLKGFVVPCSRMNINSVKLIILFFSRIKRVMWQPLLSMLMILLLKVMIYVRSTWRAFLARRFRSRRLRTSPIHSWYARSKKGTFLYHHKYVLDLLKDSGMLGCKTCKTLIKSNHCLQASEGNRLIDIGRYQRLMGKFIYLTLIRPNISYVVS